MIRQQFVYNIRSLDPMETPTIDFTKLFESLLASNGIPKNLRLVDLFDYIIFEGTDMEDDDDFSPMNMLMDCYDQNRSLYMSFLSFIVDMNVVLAKKIFQTTDFRVASCLHKTTFALEDFETVLAFDIALDSDIFRDKKYPILYKIFSTAIIPVETIGKMKKLVLAYGPFLCYGLVITLYQAHLRM